MKFRVTERDEIGQLPSEPKKAIKGMLRNPATIGNVRCVITEITYDDGRD